MKAQARRLALTAATSLAARRADIRGEVAVVTGASRGLGLLLARELAGHGCPLVICARDAAGLERAAAQLRDAGAEVTAVACDVTDEASPRLLVDTALQRYGRLDIVISNAGIIQVGPVEAARVDHYESAVETMALAPVRLALTALPVMRRQGHGRIVTIASVGGKLSVPHLLPYSTAKFAAVGFSEGLRAELGRGPVTVTTVVPGLMRTGSHLQARFTGQAGKEFTWFALGASLPLVSMDAERAARQIIGAVRRRRPEIILTPAAQVVSRLAGLAPGLTSEVLRQVQRLALPAPPEQAGHGEPIAGHDLNPALPRKAFDHLTALGRAAASRYNERPRLPRSPRPRTPAEDSWTRARAMPLPTFERARAISMRWNRSNNRGISCSGTPMPESATVTTALSAHGGTGIPKQGITFSFALMACGQVFPSAQGQVPRTCGSTWVARNSKAPSSRPPTWPRYTSSKPASV
jgi:short-subunit dehydrogenase